MRSLVALLLVASVLHTQLAVGCHCQHETGCDTCEAEHAACEPSCLWHADRHGHGAAGLICDQDHPAPMPCDGCPQCAAADPIGLRLEASSDLDAPVQLSVWVMSSVELLSTTVRHSRRRQSAPPDGVPSLLACGTLLRI